ncbi:YihY/virulence factor BrkB family protein [Acidiferrobacter thiooxydans]|uniref:YihY/virulence factor BrkB family protein n=1 Tax=Acidiferrobacter thiooxydans TaxID=163359 RepID=UPI0008261217|nr:YihY/virulence factor BrkB family protein [Acidiferrobacter thiooxydans]UEO00245.1 YihY/virulence factor BrkB family protein [Acidiferrobacter thiooxydans]
MTLKADRKSPTWTLAHLGARGLVRRVLVGVSENNLTGYSAQLAYYFFLSLFPLLLFLATLLAYLPVHHRTRTVLAVLGKALPTQALLLVKGDFEGLMHQHQDGLLSFSMAFALYSAGNAITAIGAGLNQAYDVREKRPYWRVLLMALLLVLALALVFLVAFTIFFFGPIAANALAGRLGIHLLPIVLGIIRWPILLLAVVLATALLYYFTPNVRQEWRWLTPGSLFALFGWTASSLLFAFYVNNFSSYNKTYGSIGAVIVLLTWMYLGGLVLLIGGQINSVIKHAAEDGATKTETSTDERGATDHGHRREARR